MHREVQDSEAAVTYIVPTITLGNYWLVTKSLEVA